MPQPISEISKTVPVTGGETECGVHIRPWVLVGWRPACDYRNKPERHRERATAQEPSRRVEPAARPNPPAGDHQSQHQQPDPDHDAEGEERDRDRRALVGWPLLQPAHIATQIMRQNEAAEVR